MGDADEPSDGVVPVPSNNDGPKSLSARIYDKLQITGVVLFQFTVIYPIQLIRKSLSMVFTTLGFAFSIFRDLYEHSINNRHLKWKAALTRLENYLKESGIDDELDLAVNERFLTNISVIDDVQRDLKQNRPKSTQLDPIPKEYPSLLEAAHFMRYATAVYGAEVVASAVMEVNDEEDEKIVEDAPSEPEEQILAYCHVKDRSKDCVAMNVDAGGSMDYLRHFVVVDHEYKALVFAIRGTFSVSGLVTDLVGMTESFCGGEAHIGMAEMAKATWLHAKDKILSKMTELPEDYELVVTGHSLGAGVACLINVLLHYEKPLPPGRKIRCMAYAPPPVFCPLEAAKEAVKNCTAYIHQSDCVPFLSVYAVRRFFKMMIALDKITRNMWLYEKILIDWDFRAPTKDMLDAVAWGEKKIMRDIPGAARVSIPANAVFWLNRPRTESEKGAYERAGDDVVTLKAKKLEVERKMMNLDKPPSFRRLDSSLPKPKYVATISDADKLSGLSILVHPYMISDHFPPQYEVALRNGRLVSVDELVDANEVALQEKKDQ